jgi:hypothetical protein
VVGAYLLATFAWAILPTVAIIWIAVHFILKYW